jgi:hypothetical protein
MDPPKELIMHKPMNPIMTKICQHEIDGNPGKQRKCGDSGGPRMITHDRAIQIRGQRKDYPHVPNAGDEIISQNNAVRNYARWPDDFQCRKTYCPKDEKDNKEQNRLKYKRAY